jgi:hypothetical protein
MKINYEDPEVVARQNIAPNAGCDIDGVFYDMRNCVYLLKEQDARIEELEAKLTKAVEALTPSGDTKAAYIAEVETDCPCGRPHTVSWTATKDIMKMIRERAELKGGIGDE